MSPSIEAASGWPLRSRMSPRSAGSTTSTVPSAAAIAAYEPGSSPWSCTSRAPNSESTIAIITNPTRSRTCGEPRLLPRRTVVTTALVGRAGRRVRLRGTVLSCLGC